MRRIRELMICLVAFAASGCESCGGCDQNASWVEGARQDELGTLEAAPHGDAGADAALAADEAPSARAQLKESMEQLSASLELFGKAMEAGAAAEEGDSFCERSFTGFAAMHRYLREHGRADQLGNLPNSIVFFNFCEGLEVEAQRCMVLSHVREHQEDCARVMEELPDEAKASLERMLSGR